MSTRPSTITTRNGSSSVSTRNRIRLYSSDYKFREIYLLTSAADTDAKAMNITKRGIGGWIACFDGVKLKGALCATGAESAGDVKKNSALLKKALAMGKKV